jgi:hypothetical protein
MKRITPNRAWFGILGVAAAALSIALLSGGVASAQDSARAAKPTKIKMTVDNREPVFSGPATIEQGTELKVVKRKFLPTTEKEGKQCFSKGICGPIAVAHEFDPKTGKVAKRTVEIGKSGWDKAFSLDHPGDSWYTGKENQQQTRTVSAKPGTKLFFICAVHPFMQGKITVVK